MNEMTLSEKALTSMLNSMRITATQEQFSKLLALFSHEPEDCREWTEQDIYEQIRKIIR